VADLFAPRVPTTWRTLADSYQTRIGAAVERWSRGTASDDDVQWLSWLLQNGLLSNGVAATPHLERLITEYRAVENSIPAPRVVEGLADNGPGTDFPVLIGGNAS
jgi:hypothetical protein